MRLASINYNPLNLIHVVYKGSNKMNKLKITLSTCFIKIEKNNVPKTASSLQIDICSTLVQTLKYMLVLLDHIGSSSSQKFYTQILHQCMVSSLWGVQTNYNKKIFKIFKIQLFDTLYEFEKIILQRSLWGKK